MIQSLLEVKQGAVVRCFGIPVLSIGDPCYGVPTVAQCASFLFMIDLKPPSKKKGEKLAKMSGLGIDERAPTKEGSENKPAPEVDHLEYGDDVLEAGLKDLIELAEQTSQSAAAGEEEAEENLLLGASGGNAALEEFLRSAVQSSSSEGIPASGNAAPLDEVEEELE